MEKTMETLGPIIRVYRVYTGILTGSSRDYLGII